MKSRSGFKIGSAADKIWNDHVGNNAFVVHRDQCSVCTASFKARSAGRHDVKLCDLGDKILERVIVEVFDQIDDVLVNGN